MFKVIVIGLLIALGISIYENFSLLTSSFDLQGQLDEVESKNVELLNQVTSLSSKINTLEERIYEPINETQIQLKPNEKADGKLSINSITAVAVRPILVQDGFFQNVQYQGTVMKIELTTHEGSGLVLVNTAIPTGVDFQSSAKIAAKVAENYLKTNLSNIDIIFSITADENEHLQAVDGQSAGAAMTVLLISTLQDKKPSEDVIMTGTINPDMTIGMVGGISEKADAAGNHGAKIFLVPEKQGITFVEKCDESKAGNFIYKSCSSEQKALSPMTEEKYGMKTIEVNNIKDALLYFQQG